MAANLIEAPDYFWGFFYIFVPMIRKVSFLLVSLLLIGASFAQKRVGNDGFKGADTAKVNKLTNFYFDDSLNRVRVFSWKIDPYSNIPNRTAIDTNQRNKQRIYPFYQNDGVGATYLGNIGGAYVLHDFFRIEKPTNFFFQRQYQDFTGSPEKVNFFNTKVPFSNVRYSTAGNRTEAEEIFGLTIAQNVSPALSFGINYNRFGTKGMYRNQRSKTKDFSGYVAYLGKKYTAYAGYIYNLADVKENGGIIDDKYILDTTLDKASYIEVNLKNAQNKLKANTFFLSQTYSLRLSSLERFNSNGVYVGPQVMLGSFAQYSTYHRVYSDDTAGVTNSKYYKNYYINPLVSYDSTHLREFDGRVYLQVRPYTDKSLLNMFGGGLGYQHLTYYLFNLDDYLYGNKDTKRYSTYAFGYASGKFRRYISWNGFAKLVLVGFNSGDIDSKASASFSVFPWDYEVRLQGEFKFKSETPDFYQQNYFSNHFIWQNNFERTVDSRVEVKLDIPSLAMNVGARQAIITDYIYFNKDALPVQNNGSISVSSLFIKKDLALGNFHIDGQVLFQKSSNEDVLPLPRLSINAGAYYQFNIVKNVLRSQVGVDLQYNDSYYAYAYNPAVGQFHTQSTRKVGSYPWLDAFANFKWKRAAIFVKVRNVGKSFLSTSDYFSALHYPRVPLQLQYGLSWSFYD